ncbi:hypothetical protein QAD02_007629 [Eretmocerus hayati]|uniref:Uncharacterized protein n=1 Tax=Eretmocerus hayati TaxID=131215 RepID=A0ACC2N6M7_9HYME|nr:hypothetical protein QAD02_007629 [Eretmocerus hayati]
MEPDEATSWMHQILHANPPMSVGEVVNEILSFFFEEGLTKRALGRLLALLNKVSPKPNNLNCGHHFGEYESGLPESICESCNKCRDRGIFVEYNLEQILKDAFEVRNLKNLIDQHRETTLFDNDDLSDFTSGSEVKTLPKKAIKTPYDVLVLWNVDGGTISNSSPAQIWPLQTRIMNIPPARRRAFQNLIGIYYGTKKPPMDSFLTPFTNAMRDLYENSVKYHDQSTRTEMTSYAIAPRASLDSPARALVANFHFQCGLYGCILCEHLGGESCPTGRGHTWVYPPTPTAYPLRTEQSVLKMQI